ncbi:MAG: HAD family hydrolase [Spirochaetales bacterium]|nr:HAD family hydrolase [Spirochaetales bacterium]
MKYRAVIFDLDGTLLDTLSDLADAMNSVLAGWGYPVHPESSYKMFIGGGVEEFGRKALPPEERTERKIKECVDKMQAVYRKNWAKKTRPYPGILPMLHVLEKRGIKLAVLSNKMHDFTVEIVKFFFDSIPFSEVLGAGDHFPIKPDPAGALETARRMAISPSECLLVGDSGSDMQTARQAGMTAVGVLWGFREREELRRGGAHFLIEKVCEIEALI